MNKTQLVEALATHSDGDKIEAARALNAVIQTITYSTAQEERVTITGFGTSRKCSDPPGWCVIPGRVSAGGLKPAPCPSSGPALN